MNILILDTKFETVAALDEYESFIWTDRYNEYGDFEIYLSPYSKVMEYLISGHYLWMEESEHTMLIKSIEVTTDPEDGAHATITGKSLESILMDRIITNQTIIEGNFQNGIKTLLDECIIAPTDPNRKISNFIFQASTDSRITDLTIEGQYFGQNLYDVVSALCYSEGVGFKVTLNALDQFVFELYVGEDRSWDQANHPYVVFSPRFDNLLSSSYRFNSDNVKNVAYVAGEEPDEESGKTRVIAISGEGVGLNRKEIFVDANSIKSTYRDDDGETVELSEAEYNEQLVQRGTEELTEYTLVEGFDGQIASTDQWQLGRDFFIGDIVQIENEYGRTAKSRVIEMIRADDTTGIQFYPTFESVES